MSSGACGGGRMAALRLFSRYLFLKNGDSLHNISSTFIIFNRSLNYLPKRYGTYLNFNLKSHNLTFNKLGYVKERNCILDEKDPAPLFFNNEIQSLLKTLTRPNLNKVYRRRHLGQPKLELPTYKFATDEMVQDMLKESEKKMNELLQMPPVIKVRSAVDKIVSKDPALEGYDTSSYVFTDITFGIKNIDRIILIREPNGTLREADWQLRERMNQIYLPIPGREMKTPEMFQEKYLESLLERKEFEFILDRSCLQFEPDDPEYQRVVSITYQYINDNHAFETLRSTRHFGPLVFFLIWHKDIDNLLLDLIQTSQIQEANTLLQLYEKFHKVELITKDSNEVNNVEKYIKEFSNKRASLELALQAYKEMEEQRRNIEHDIKHAHGIV